MHNAKLFTATTFAAALAFSGAAYASLESDIARYAPNQNQSNLTTDDKNQIQMILSSSMRDSDKRNRVRNVVRKSNE